MRRLRLAYLGGILACVTLFGHSERLGIFPALPMAREHVERGLIASWQASSVNPAGEIRVYDIRGKLAADFTVAGVVPEAKKVSIWDVSVLPADRIAVAAVFVKAGSVQSSLLLFDFSGNLQSAFALAPSRGIGLLELDEQSNIWTVTEAAGSQSPSEVPLIVEYDSNGKEMRKILTRDAFGTHAKLIKSSINGGHPNIGYDAGQIWLWLPESTDLVLVNTVSGEASRLTTGLPTLPDKVHPVTVFRVSADRYLLQTYDTRDESKSMIGPTYAWSPSSQRWSVAHLSTSEACGPADRALLGIAGAKVLLLDRESKELCSAEETDE